MIDFHSHILPGVDDGSRDLEMTTDMINNSIVQGVEAISATPHYIPGEHEITLHEYTEKFNLLTDKFSEKINIIRGMEIYINPELPRLYKENAIWGYNGGKYLLIELPMEQFPIYTEKIFYDLRLLGAVPVLAHPERNISIMNKPELLINLIEQGNIAQINSGSLTGIYGSTIKKFAEKLVKMNLIHLIGSDGHNNGKRNTNLLSGFNRVKELNIDLYKWIIENENNILNSIDIEIPDIILDRKKRSFFNFWKKFKS